MRRNAAKFVVVILVLIFAAERYYSRRDWDDCGAVHVSYSIVSNKPVKSPDILQQHEKMTTKDWRHFNSAIQFVNHSQVIYIGRVNQLVTERIPGFKVHRIKVNKFFISNVDEHVNEYILNGSDFTNPFTNYNRRYGGQSPRQFELNENFDCEISKKDWVDGGHGYQDPRLFAKGTDLYLIFNSRPQVSNAAECGPLIRTIYCSKISLMKIMGKWHVEYETPIKLSWNSNKETDENIVERNWSPLIFNDKIYFSYLFYPDHIVISCPFNDTAVECKEEYRSNSVEMFHETFKELHKSSSSKINYIDFARKLHPHGGTPSIAITSENGDRFYLGILHISFTVDRNKVYRNFVYILSGHPPFQIKYVSSQHLDLTDKLSGRFSDLQRWAPNWYINSYPSRNSRITFVCDITKVHGEDDHFYISYGVNDGEGKIAKLKINIYCK